MSDPANVLDGALQACPRGKGTARRISGLMLLAGLLLTGCGSPAAAPTAAPVLLGTGLPTTLAPITTGNSGQLRWLATWTTNAPVKWALEFSPDSRLLAAALDQSGQNSIAIFEVQRGSVSHRIDNIKGRVLRMAFSRDGKQLAAIYEKTVQIWNTADWQAAGPISTERTAFSLTFSPDGKLLVIGLEDGSIKIWDLAAGQVARTLKAGADLISDVSFSPDGATLAVASVAKIDLWDTTTWQSLRSLTGHTRRVWTASFAPNGKSLVSASDDGSVRVWNTSSGQQEALLNEQAVTEWYSAQFSSDGQMIVASSGLRLNIWDAASGKRLASRGLMNALDYITIMKMAPNQQLIATGEKDIHLFAVG